MVRFNVCRRRPFTRYIIVLWIQNLIQTYFQTFTSQLMQKMCIFLNGKVKTKSYEWPKENWNVQVFRFHFSALLHCRYIIATSTRINSLTCIQLGCNWIYFAAKWERRGRAIRLFINVLVAILFWVHKILRIHFFVSPSSTIRIMLIYQIPHTGFYFWSKATFEIER